jgi:hypothetical protein
VGELIQTSERTFNLNWWGVALKESTGWLEQECTIHRKIDRQIKAKKQLQQSSAGLGGMKSRQNDIWEFFLYLVE